MLRTPLYDLHATNHGKFVDFAGWELPIAYDWPTTDGKTGGGILEEHHQVRNSGGIFDVSHMGRVHVKGRHARRLLERLVTRRIQDMTNGQCRYALVLNEQGGVKDDVLVYRLEEDHYLVVCNASNREKIVAHMHAVQAMGGRERSEFNCKIEDKTLDTAMIAVQGPKVMELIGEVSSEIPTLKRYRFTQKNFLVMKLLVSRTGYTGEDGVEVILPAKSVKMALGMLFKKLGDPSDPNSAIKLCGLGARDTLRLEAGMALYGHELSEDIDALTTGIGFAMNLDKHEDERGESFIGREALEAIQANGGPTQALTGFLIEGKRAARQGMTILDANDKPVGAITSGGMSPSIGQPIAMGYLNNELVTPGTAVKIDCGKGRTIDATTCKTPFAYKQG